MSNYRNILIAGAMLLCFMYGSSWAEEYKSIKIQPGNYEFTETSSSTQNPDEVVKKTDNCVKNDEIEPASKMAERDGCEISNYKSKDNALSFDFVCKNVKASSTTSGSIEYVVSGEEISWKKAIKTEFEEGGDFSVKSAGKAVRKGDCS